jgi:hypothetical protein
MAIVLIYGLGYCSVNQGPAISLCGDSAPALPSGSVKSMLRGMNMDPNQFPAWLAVLIPVLILIAIWDGAWKVVGMWKSARHNQLAWFICLALFNTMGILPIVYLVFFQRDRNEAQSSQPPVAG